MATRRKISLPRYNLKEGKSKEPTLIYLIYRYKYDQDGNRVRLKYSTGKKVIPKFWLGERARESLHHPEYRELNTFLRDLQNEVQRIVKKESLISVDDLKQRLDIFNGYLDGREYLIPTLPQYIDQFIRKVDRDQRTIQKYLGVKKKLEAYAKEKKIVLSFDKITLDFKNDFVKWLYANKVNSQNTVNKLLTTIKQFMREAASERIVIDGELRSYHDNRDYLHKDFSVRRVKTSKHFLELSELEKLAKYDLSGQASYELVRDLFLISCYTGLRISDLQRLRPQHIIREKEDAYIHIHTFKGRRTKSDNEVVIPVLPELDKVLKKYDYSIPACLSEQKHNEYIKVICEKAGIDRNVIHKESVKGEMKESSIPVYTKISNHTGRYTFINFMLNEYNVRPERLQKITGQSLKVLMGYEREDKKKNAKRVLKALFPTESNIRKIS